MRTGQGRPTDIMELAANLWRYLARYKGWIALAFVAIFLYTATTVLIVSLVGPIVEAVVPSGAELISAVPLPGAGTSATDAELGDAMGVVSVFDLDGQLGRLYDVLKSVFGVGPKSLFFAPAVFFAVFLLRMVALFLSRYAFQHAGLGVTTDLRNDLCDRILRQSNKFHAEHTSGELYSRVVSDVDKMQNAVSSQLFDIFQQLFLLAGLVYLLLSIHPKLASICLLATPLIVYPMVRIGKGMRSTSFRSQERVADLSSLLTESIRGHRIVKAFGMESFELRRFKEATRQHLNVNLRAQILSSYSSPVVESIAALVVGVLIVGCGFLIRDGELTLPRFAKFMLNLVLLYDPIRKLNRANLVLQAALAPARRVFDLLAVPNDIEEVAEPAPLTGLRDSIEFDHVSFGYRDAYVLNDFCLSIQRGQRVALVGASGAGKSTVANLLLRFFDPGKGAVRIDGVDIRNVSLVDLRALMGLVSQDTILFNDTVRNNIAYGHDEMALERVRGAAAASYADNFIMAMENGYDSVIGESGHQLSGGQRQRLAIARALLKDAPILILDEATSQLDTESEAAVQKALDNLMQDRTTLVIAHRLSTITSADVIIVMENGRIVESGTHEKLVQAGGTYRRLYDLQFKT